MEKAKRLLVKYVRNTLFNSIIYSHNTVQFIEYMYVLQYNVYIRAVTIH